MKKYIFFLIASVVFLFNCRNEEKLIDSEIKESEIKSPPPAPSPLENNNSEFAIAIHGGAGTILKENMSAEKEVAYKEKLEEAIRAGYAVLNEGGTSIDAVEIAINILEDSPLFNAGKGAVFTNSGTNELDASIMDGSNLNAGASAGTKIVRNPISLARVIMEKSPHVILAGEGAEQFAKEQNLEIVGPSYFYTDNRMKSLNRIKERELDQINNIKKSAFYENQIEDYKFGTVGCVALDKYGNLAAGTSTGGMTNKRWGRIGDAPIIGAGTYANNNTCAVSSTGWGEYFIRAMVAHDISALMEYKGLSLEEAAKLVIQKKVPELGGDGGIIAVDKTGNIVLEFNTAGMYRASMTNDNDLKIAIYKE